MAANGNSPSNGAIVTGGRELDEYGTIIEENEADLQNEDLRRT